MNGTTALHDTITLLRSVEHYCYQIAYYLLGNERDAAEASKLALLSLSVNPRFADAGTDERRRLAKSASISCAMQRAGGRFADGNDKEPIPQVVND
ncbi:hypothetical protein [Paenibacillus glycinis]|uniref:Uncharacterized protein n=1 Tax=Paenibacillus glycinis TaxID=2697035 RepID=A0ABW9XJL7_9BACL|nr:hypothetical protein [Paenibacillus glycinis]NBD22807.1 hypothetical protein [Paenibacillus glycinis]